MLISDHQAQHRLMMWAMGTVTILALSFINLAGMPSNPVALLALIFKDISGPSLQTKGKMPMNPL